MSQGNFEVNIVVAGVLLVTAGSGVVLATGASPAYIGTVLIATTLICVIAIIVSGSPWE